MNPPGRLLDLAAILPAFNEAVALPSVVAEWRAALDGTGADYEIHVFDDGSTDRSAAVLDELAAGHPRLRAHRHVNRGHGPTILRAYRELAERAEWLFQTDSDGELGPDAFSAFWAARGAFDLVIARRSGRAQTAPRRLVSAVSRAAVAALFGRGIHDVNAPYRLLRSAAFAPGFRSIPGDAFAPNVLVSGYAIFRRLRIVELPVAHRARHGGISSLGRGRLLRATVKALGQTIAYRARIGTGGRRGAWRNGSLQVEQRSAGSVKKGTAERLSGKEQQR